MGHEQNHQNKTKPLSRRQKEKRKTNSPTHTRKNEGIDDQDRTEQGFSPRTPPRKLQ